MLYSSAVLIYLAFILGLLLSGITWGGVIFLCICLIIAILRWGTGIALFKRGPQTWLWIGMGVMGCAASFYVQWRSPQANLNEVGRVAALMNPQQPTAVYVVEGSVESLPRLTRSDRQQIWLQAQSIRAASSVQGQSSQSQSENNSAANNNSTGAQNVSGRVYVTLPKTDKISLHPNQTVALTGRIYQPRRTSNPVGFDFESWLTRQNAFSGMKAEAVKVLSTPEPPFALWRIKQRIINSQQAWLKGSAGPLIGAMVLGNRAVDLPFETQDAFIQVGLAHALAASGFQISLILACLMALLRSLPNSLKFAAGSLALLVFLGLSGVEASVLRAVLMGLAGLIALILGRKMKPVPILIFIAFVMLIIQPLWIWDLGFQLSFLATLGLIVTAPALQEKLDWLPTTIAAAIAVPLAAMVWTIPLQLHSFGIIPTYALIANIITTPLISLVTLGGFISAIAGLIFPLLGSILAFILGVPTNLLLWIVTQLNRLPGKTWAVGSISPWQLALVYGAIVMIWLIPAIRKRWPTMVGLTLLGIFVPIWSVQGNLSQITLFDAGKTPIMVIQQPQSTVLINTGDEQTCERTVLPFLQHQGINRVDVAIATDLKEASQKGWQAMQQHIQLDSFSPVSLKNPAQLQEHMLAHRRKMRWQPLLPDQRTRVEQASVKVLRNSPALLEFQINQMKGLMINEADNPGLSTWLSNASVSNIQAIWFTGSRWNSNIIEMLDPKVVIFSHPSISTEAIANLDTSQRQVYWTKRDGAVQWEPQKGFTAVLDPNDEKSPLL